MWSATVASAGSSARCLTGTNFLIWPLIRTPRPIAEYRKAGRQVFYGEASDLSFLESCGLAHARAVVVTIHTKSAIDDIVKLVRRVRPDIAIISRARDAEHARHLYAIDVTDAVPETVEASLQLSEATLVSIGLPAGPVIASIHQLRDEFRQELQTAAGRRGRHWIYCPVGNFEFYAHPPYCAAPMSVVGTNLPCTAAYWYVR